MKAASSKSSQTVNNLLRGSLGPFFLTGSFALTFLNAHPGTLWYVGQASSFILGLFITAVSLMEIIPSAHEIKEQQPISLEPAPIVDIQKEHLEALAKKEEIIVQQQQEITSLTTALASVQEMIHQERAAQDDFLKGIQSENASLLNLLNTLRVDHYQLSILNESVMTEDRAHKEEIALLNTELERYLQIKQQFQEKTEVLSQTRKDLFALETAYLTLQKQQQEQALDLNPNETALIAQLQALEEERREQEIQIEHMQAIIVELLGKKPAPRAKKIKKSATLQEVLLPLNDLLKLNS